MANEVKKQDEKMVTQFEVNGNPVKLSADTVRNFLVSGNGNITDSEAMMFISLCRYQHLNPFLNEAYLVKFGNSPAQQIVSKEAFMKRAEQNPHFKGMQAGCIVHYCSVISQPTLCSFLQCRYVFMCGFINRLNTCFTPRIRYRL